MVSELRTHIANDAVFFGIRETLKQNKKIARVFVTSDVRPTTLRTLEEKKIETTTLESPKTEVAEKLGLSFLCEVFGVKK